MQARAVSGPTRIRKDTPKLVSYNLKKKFSRQVSMQSYLSNIRNIENIAAIGGYSFFFLENHM